MSEDIEDQYDLIRLDKSAPDLAKVTENEHNAHFHQGGLYFHQDGRLCVAMLTDGDKAKLRRKVAVAMADKAAESARNKALKSAGIDPSQLEDASKPKPAAVVADKAPAETNEVDLLAWSRKEKTYSWFKVRAAFAAQHAKEVENKEDAIIWLIDNGLVDKDEVAV